MLPCFPEAGCREHGYRGTQPAPAPEGASARRLHARPILGESRAEDVYSQESAPLLQACSVSLVSACILPPWPISLLIERQVIKQALPGGNRRPVRNRPGWTQDQIRWIRISSGGACHLHVGSPRDSYHGEAGSERTLSWQFPVGTGERGQVAGGGRRHRLLLMCVNAAAA